MSISSVGASSLLQQMQQALFAKADVNGDGQLSSDEFMSIGQNLPQPGNGGPPRPIRGGDLFGGNFSPETMGSLLSAQQDRADKLTNLFNAADTDGDGQVTADELAANLATTAGSSASSSDLAAKAASLIKAGDTNGDGSMSLAEFQAIAPPPHHHRGGNDGDADDGAASAAASTTSTAGAASASSGVTYDPADTNKDGQVSMSELLASLQASQGSFSGFSSEASDLLAKLLTSLSASVSGSTATSTVSASA